MIVLSLALFGLVLFAAFTHAFWNFLFKRESGNLGLIWIGNGLMTVLALPLALFVIYREGFDPAAIPYLLATAGIHVFYFIFLSQAYRRCEISVVYPVARGIGVAGTALLGRLLLDEVTSPRGVIGIIAVCLGVLLIGLSGGGWKVDLKALAYAAATGCTIVGYSLVDKLGVGVLPPLLYIILQFSLITLFMAPYILRHMSDATLAVWRGRKLPSLAVGFCAMGTYALILWAFRLGQVSYIVPLRESSVLIGALLGVIFLKERLTAARIGGIVLILAGLAAIKFA